MLDEEKIKKVIEENIRITPQAQSENITEQNIAYGRRQGINDIRDLLNASYAEGFRTYNYFTADCMESEDAGRFYDNRIGLLKNWLSDEAKDQFSEKEKEYLVHQYETLNTPFLYDYMLGWTQFFEYAPTIIMISMLILGYLVAGIFSNEFQYKADAIFFTSVYGRNKAISAKINAGFCIVTSVYWIIILIYSIVVLFFFGLDGAACPVQADRLSWKYFYNILNWQKYLLTVIGGYMGCLFISFLAMLISAKTKSAVLAVIIPFVLIFILSFLGNINNPIINKILRLLPDRLLQVNVALGYFDLYMFIGKVVGAIPILFVMYSILTIVLLPAIYQEYRHKQID